MPRRANTRHKPATNTLFPASEVVPCTINHFFMQSLNDGLECASVAHSATTLTRGATSPLKNQEALAYLNTVSVWYFAVFNEKAFIQASLPLPLVGEVGRGYFEPEELNSGKYIFQKKPKYTLAIRMVVQVIMEMRPAYIAALSVHKLHRTSLASTNYTYRSLSMFGIHQCLAQRRLSR